MRRIFVHTCHVTASSAEATYGSFAQFCSDHKVCLSSCGKKCPGHVWLLPSLFDNEGLETELQRDKWKTEEFGERESMIAELDNVLGRVGINSDSPYYNSGKEAGRQFEEKVWTQRLTHCLMKSFHLAREQLRYTATKHVASFQCRVSALFYQ